jgi:hypothetical protein
MAPFAHLLSRRGNLQLGKVNHFSLFLSVFGLTIKQTEGNIQKERKWDCRERHNINYKKIILHLFGLSGIFSSSLWQG